MIDGVFELLSLDIFLIVIFAHDNESVLFLIFLCFWWFIDFLVDDFLETSGFLIIVYERFEVGYSNLFLCLLLVFDTLSGFEDGL